MTFEDAKQILKILRIVYPQSFRDYDAETAKYYCMTWAEMFKDIPAQLVLAIVKEAIKEPGAFAPTPGDIYTRVRHEIAADSQSEAVQAFEQAKKLVCSIGIDWLTKDEYNTLPELTRRCLTYDEVKQIGRNGPDYNEQWVKPRFVKAYTGIKETHDKQLMKDGKWAELLSPERALELGLAGGENKEIGHKEK